MKSERYFFRASSLETGKYGEGGGYVLRAARPLEPGLLPLCKPCRSPFTLGAQRYALTHNKESTKLFLIT